MELQHKLLLESQKKILLRFSTPFNLQIANTKTSSRAKEVDSHANFTARLWIRIEQVHVEVDGT